MYLSIVIPVYNEEKVIEHTVRTVRSFMRQNFNNNFEIIIVNDGSTDNTFQLLTVLKDSQVHVITYKQNRGKGYALKTGIGKAKGKYIYIADSDLATPISEISKFLNYIHDYDCIIGSRAQKGAKEKSSMVRILAGKLGNILINLLLNLDIKDTQCGFKLFNSKLSTYFINCETNGWGYDFEFLYKVKDAGYKIKEIPVKWSAGAKSSVGFRSYVNTLIELIKIWWKEEGLSIGYLSKLFKRTRMVQKYFVGGVLTNVINIGGFYYLLYVVKMSDWQIGSLVIPHYIIIESVAYTTAVIFNFMFHKLLTFKSSRWNLGEFARYGLLLFINYVIGVILLYAMVDRIGIYEGLAKLAVVMVVIMWNFFALKYFVYKS